MDFFMVTYPDVQQLIMQYIFLYKSDSAEAELYEVILEHIYKNNQNYFKKLYTNLCRFTLLKKYKAYSNIDFVYTLIDDNSDSDNVYGGDELLDALFTGCNLPFARSTFTGYTASTEQDIKFIVEYIPHSIKCTKGQLRCREYVTPLAAACMNINIPMHIIECLLQNGADPNGMYKLNGRYIKIIDDFKNTIAESRYNEVYNLFVRYGLKL
jgi:hypothetical protein